MTPIENSEAQVLPIFSKTNEKSGEATDAAMVLKKPGETARSFSNEVELASAESATYEPEKAPDEPTGIEVRGGGDELVLGAGFDGPRLKLPSVGGAAEEIELESLNRTEGNRLLIEPESLKVPNTPGSDGLGSQIPMRGTTAALASIPVEDSLQVEDFVVSKPVAPMNGGVETDVASKTKAVPEAETSALLDGQTKPGLEQVLNQKDSIALREVAPSVATDSKVSDISAKEQAATIVNSANASQITHNPTKTEKEKGVSEDALRELPVDRRAPVMETSESNQMATKQEVPRATATQLLSGLPVETASELKISVHVTEDAEAMRLLEPTGTRDRPNLNPTIVPAGAQNAGAATRQVLNQLSAGIQQLNDGGIEIRLNPVELGRITIQIVDGISGHVANVIVEKPEVLDLLRRNETMLQSEFESAGYKDMPFEFEQRDQAEPSDEEQPAHSLTADTGEPIPAIQINYATRVTSDLDIRL